MGVTAMKTAQAKKIYAKTLPPTELKLDEAREYKATNRDTVTKTQEFKTLAEQVTKSSVYHKNWYVDELRETFKYFDRMKRVDKVFPYAKINETGTCMVLIDEPSTEIELEQCFRKAAILRGIGYKYAIIEKDSSLFDVLEQLDAI